MAKRYFQPPMVDNPQPLVANVDVESLKNAKLTTPIQAIYIPFKDRFNFVRTLLKELECFDGPIYLLPSNRFESKNIPNLNGKNTHLLYVEDESFVLFFSDLATSNHKFTKSYVNNWKLPLKRNFALRHASVMGFRKILIVDDDIRSIDKKRLKAGADCLDKYALAGCFVNDFLDTSVLGHLEKAAGEEIHPFLSGSFLFIKPPETQSFFPCLYNEDWLFMIPHVQNGTACSFGNVRQEAFDPFGNLSRPVFQEFGEIIIEGLYALIESKQYEFRFKSKTWIDVIAQRREILKSLSKRLAKKKHQITIKQMLESNSHITEADCCDFISYWERDTISWSKYIGGFK
jgi:hypothetical protein